MLTKSLVRGNFLVFKIFAALGLLPVEINVKDLKVYRMRNFILEKSLHFCVRLAVCSRQFYALFVLMSADLYKVGAILGESKTYLITVHGWWLESVPEKGVVAMGNRPFDRMTLPSYLEFYADQLASLLLAS